MLLKNNCMKKLILREWVKYFILIVVMILISFLVSKFVISSDNDFEKQAKRCDKEKRSICSYYEVRQFMINNR